MKQDRVPKNFGIPEVDNTPLGLVRMEGQLYRGLSNRAFRNPFFRMVGVVFALVFLAAPGLGAIYAGIEYKNPMWGSSPLVIAVIQVGVGLIFFIAGLRIIYNLLVQPKNEKLN